MMEGFKSLERKRTTLAWLGLDSVQGRYLIGKGDSPVKGIVRPDETATICTNAHALFRAQRFFVKRSCASSFLIRNVFVGSVNSGSINQQPIICEPFAADFDKIASWDAILLDNKLLELKVDKKALELSGQPWPLPVLQPGYTLTMTVENIGDEPCRFLAAFTGEAMW